MKMNKKGITLVEVIVVLIIMAVLAGILVASYTGYIDKANKDAVMVEARAAYLAASTEYHEDYASKANGAVEDDWTSPNYTDIQKLAGVSGTIAVTDVEDGKIVAMTYTKGTVKCTLADGVWTVAEVTP